MTIKSVTVIGAGLAGVEAAFTLSKQGIRVRLCEMKPHKYTPAHTHEGFAELVCSNSLKSDNLSTAGGLLKAEMRLLGSLTLQAAEKTKVAAGGALAVDRAAFSDEITRIITDDKNIEIIRGEITEFPNENTIIATGPLTSDSFTDSIKQKLTSLTSLTSMSGKPDEVGNAGKLLAFYDAAAPIVTAESIDMNKAFLAARYNKGGADYINCPFNKEQYELFYNELINAQSADLHDIDKGSVYEGCIPVEVLAKRGIDSIRYGCMKPVGLTPPDGSKPYAVVQLRRENAGGTMYNIVGFQTNLKFGEQKRVFSLIPGLENAQFVRYGVMHRNTFINSPRLLNSSFMLRDSVNIYFAGQITGVEGYMESAASGIIAALAMAGKLPPLPPTTMLGALTNYVCGSDTPTPTPAEGELQSGAPRQPMGANMGLLPPLNEIIKNKQQRYEKLSQRAINDLERSLIT
jgi:methylenetetrahydrofolate--tRNA-(uracil-5-)-methyltransferase